MEPPGESHDGFTLVELLVVIAIVGILSAVAIPQYAAFKMKAKDADMQSALHSGRQAMEAFYVDFETYLGADANTNLPNTYGYKGTNPDISFHIVAQTNSSYIVCVGSTGGTTPAFVFNSAVGVMQPAASCP